MNSSRTLYFQKGELYRQEILESGTAYIFLDFQKKKLSSDSAENYFGSLSLFAWFACGTEYCIAQRRSSSTSTLKKQKEG